MSSSIFINMELGDNIQVGELVTVIDDTFGLHVNLFENKDKLNKTIYPWDNISIKKGTIGLVLDFVKKDTYFLKVLWTINGDSVILFVRIGDLKLLDYEL